MTSAVIVQRVVPRSRVNSVLLVIGAAALTALAAQWEIHLPFTPVPVTGQTFAVLLTGAALGMTLGAAGQAVYVVAGAFGLPVYAGGASGWDTASAQGSAGYLIGFIFAAGFVGFMAERRQDRTFPTMFTAFHRRVVHHLRLRRGRADDPARHDVHGGRRRRRRPICPR